MTPTRFSLLVFAILLAAVFRGEGVAKYGAGEVGAARLLWIPSLLVLYECGMEGVGAMRIWGQVQNNPSKSSQ